VVLTSTATSVDDLGMMLLTGGDGRTTK
jgi:hypothetical protein